MSTVAQTSQLCQMQFNTDITNNVAMAYRRCHNENTIISL